MKLLSIEDILAIHILTIEETGGSEGVRDLPRLQSAIASMSQTVFGEDAYVTIFDKSASLIRSVIGGHPFIDGNKRTAMLSAITQLKINNLNFTAETGEIEDFAVKAATEKPTVETIAVWLKNHCEPVP